jgi:class 3 adenylate cyclase/tetratricopeptide (TPR) repeat protein
MACARCGTELPAGLRFCVHCGAPQDATYASCGAALLPEARFCGSCGKPVIEGGAAAVATLAAPKPPVGAERRMCSVLFADLVGFTPLSATRDPEDVRELLSRYFEVARKIVARHGGVVEKFIGDAVMAVWGTPVATEEDAERAVRAGLELVDAVRALGTESGVDGLAARAGVVTGEVAVTLGAIGEGMVAGDAVNTAARVQAAATPGAVFVDSTTRRLTAAAIAYADEGEHTLKGRVEPEQLWRVTRVVAAVGGAQRVDGLEAGLIGRDSELRLLKELFHAAAERRTPRLVVVAGAAGVGKSRLGWEFEKYIDGLAQVVNWHRGRCLSYGEGVAFWALAETVRQRLGIAEDDPTAAAAEKMGSALPAIVPDPDERAYVMARLNRLLGLPSSDDGESHGREELFAGWRIFFERLAATSPVVLLIEDGQYADSGLLDFFDHLVDWARDLPIFVLVLTRPELEQRRNGFGVGRNRTALTLDPLDRNSMNALVEALVPGIPTQARDAVTAHAQGIALFAVETVRSLVDRDIVQPIEGAYRLVGDVGELTVPDSLHALLAARLDALAPEVRALVADAAVLGTNFPAEAVVAVSDQSEDAVRASLAELLRREVLEVSADPLSPQRGEYRFAQHLLRQVAYDTLSRRDRKARHLAVAAHLRATFADDGEEVSDAIARHYRDALAAAPDDPDIAEIGQQAVRMWVRAADRANRAGAPATAAALYAAAAELAEDVGGNTDNAAAWWEQAAAAARLADDSDACLGHAERASALYTAAGRDRDAARVGALSGRVVANIGQLRLARERLRSAYTVLAAEPDVDTVAALLYLAQVENIGGTAESNSLTQEALELGQALDVGDVLLAELFIARGVAHAIGDRPAQAVAALEYATRLAGRAGDRECEGKAFTNLSDALAPIDPRAAADAARTAADRARQVGARRQLAFAQSNLAEALFTIGEWDEATAVLEAAYERDGLDHNDITHVNYTRLVAMRGDVDAARQLASSYERFETSEDPQDISAMHLFNASIAEATGDHATALAHATTALISESELGIRAESIRWAWALAARSAHNVGDRAAELALLDGLDEHPVGKLPQVLRAERDVVRARLAAGSDDEQAATLFERAIDAYRKIPALFHLAHALLDHAEFLTRTGDSAAAELAVAEATQIAGRLGARPLAERAAAAAAAAGALTG